MTPKKIEDRRGELLAALWAEGHNVGMPTEQAQLARSARIAQLQAELDALPKPPAQETGEAAGIVTITRGGFLGDPWTPPEREPDPAERAREADPYLRYMRELGQDWL